MSDTDDKKDIKKPKKAPRIRKDGRPDGRANNKPPPTNALAGRQKLSQLIRLGKQTLNEQDEPDSESVEETPSPLPIRKKQKPVLKKKKKIVYESESEDEEEDESDSDVIIFKKKGKGKKQIAHQPSEPIINPTLVQYEKELKSLIDSHKNLNLEHSQKNRTFVDTVRSNMLFKF